MNVAQLVKGVEVWSVEFPDYPAERNPYLRHGVVSGQGKVYTTIHWDGDVRPDRASTRRLALRVHASERDAWVSFQIDARGKEEEHRDLARRWNEAKNYAAYQLQQP